MTGVPDVGYFDGVGGEGSEDIGEGVGRNIFLETCREWFVENVFDGWWRCDRELRVGGGRGG